MENKFGKTSRIAFRAVNQDGRTIVEDLSFTAPFKITHPFYKPDQTMQIIPLSASAGIMEGDVQEFDIRVEPEARLEVTSQSFEKIHRMAEGKARRNAVVRVAENAYCFYNPLPAIPFAGSAYESRTEIILEDQSSRFVLQEILCCGRKAMGEVFACRSYQSLVQVHRAGRLIYRDNTRFEPEIMDMEGIGMYEGYSHLSNILLCGFGESESRLERIRDILSGETQVAGGATMLVEGNIAIRILGQNAWKLQEIGKRIIMES